MAALSHVFGCVHACGQVCSGSFPCTHCGLLVDLTHCKRRHWVCSLVENRDGRCTWAALPAPCLFCNPDIFSLFISMPGWCGAAFGLC